jgi:predicted metal-dependent hydrolase
MEYTLIRSRRKTMAIHITKEAEVEVRAPNNMTKAEIERFIKEKQKWINKHINERQHTNEQKQAFRLQYGDTVLLQGKAYPIAAKPGNRIGFDGREFYMPPDLPSNQIKYAVIQIYKLTAKRIITNKVLEYSKRMSLIPTAVRITSAKTRWGSCSGRNRINFSWYLCMADDDVIDYVVVHELAHIKEHNHSPRFWAIVEDVLPDYKERQGKLKELQKKLAKEDWEA